MAYSLVLLNGPTPGAAVHLDRAGGPVTIGRDAARELPVDDHRCSRLHARVWCEGQHWLIEDCGSRNGTLLNAQPIQRNVLEPGDVIRVGDRLIVFVDEGDLPSVAGLRPSKLAASTFVVRVAEPDKHEAVVEQLRIDSNLRPMRDAAILCRLATQLHEQPTVPALVQLAISTLLEATQAETAAVYLVATDGRLRCVGKSAGLVGSANDAHVLASLALANDEALLVQQGVAAPHLNMPPNERGPADSTDAASNGTAISVPIPGRAGRRGAVECHRGGARPAFGREDLDMAIAIVHQVGLALENVEHREQLEMANEQLRQTIVGQKQIVGQGPAMRGLLDFPRPFPPPSRSPSGPTLRISGDSDQQLRVAR